MYKQLLVMVLLSLLAVFALKYFSWVVTALIACQTSLAHLLAQLFSTGFVARTIATTMAYFILPLCLGGLALLLKSLTHSRFIPEIMPMMWGVWLVQMTALALR